MSIGDYSGGRAGIYIMHESSATWTHLTIYLVAVSFWILWSGCRDGYWSLGNAGVVIETVSYPTTL